MRPHIIRIDRLWYCAGAGRIAVGFDPTMALKEWEMKSFYFAQVSGDGATGGDA
jgi:hypothetical protein